MPAILPPLRHAALLVAGLTTLFWANAGPAQTKTDTPPVSPATAPAAKHHPILAFATLPFMEDPELSPDGTRIAAKVAIDGKQMLVIIDRRTKTPKFTKVPVGKNDLNWWHWVNNDWLLIGIGSQRPLGDGRQIYLRRAISISADAKQNHLLGPSKIGQNADDVLWIAPDGSPYIYLSLQTSIFSNDQGFWPAVDRINVATGKTHLLVASRQGVLNWYVDAAGNVRVGVKYRDSSRRSWLYYRDNNSEKFKPVEEVNHKQDEHLLVPELFLADPHKALALDDSSGFETVRQLDLTNMALGDTVFAAPGYDVDAIIPDEAGNALAGVRYVDTRQRVHWFDPKLAKIQAELNKAVGPERWAHIASMSRDHKHLMIDVGAPDRMNLYYSFNVDEGVMQLFANSNEIYGGQPFAPVRTIHYKARDGLEIAAVLTLPRGIPAKNLPLILFPHGGPAARDYEHWDWIAQFLADRGYAVIQPNYRGSTGYGDAFEKKGEGQWGRAMQDDLNDAVDWMVKQGMADPKRVCIVGASYGGYAAMRAAQRDGGRFRCAVSYAGVSNLNAMMGYDRGFLNHSSRKDWLKKQAPNFSEVSPINFPEQFSTPILLVHGAKDLRVPVSQSRDMADKLKDAHKVYRYVEQPLGDHHFSRQADRVQFLKELGAFLDKYDPA